MGWNPLEGGMGMLGGDAGELLFGKDYGGSQLKGIQKLLAGLQSQQMHFGYANPMSFQKKALAEIDKGFGGANFAANQGAKTASKQVLDYSKQQQAAGVQSLQSKGLGGTTVAENYNRGISADTTRALSGIQNSLAQQLGGLGVQQAGAKAGIYGAMGQQSNMFAQLLQQLKLGQAQIEAGVTHQGGQGLLGPIMQGVGMFMGA